MQRKAYICNAVKTKYMQNTPTNGRLSENLVHLLNKTNGAMPDARTPRWVYATLALLSFGILFFVSPDSYTHDVFGQLDAPWFFLCGKAWMNGMVPYVDFADSKGPLLWLIFGLGYLLSPMDYIGVFWISVAFYFVTYLYTYKTARLFLADDRLSVACAAMMSLFYFNPAVHYEIRAEDFALTFVALLLYLCCKSLYSERRSKTTAYRSLFATGLCLGVLAFVKFNIAAMASIFALFLMIEGWRQRCGIAKMALLAFSGFVAVALPFVVYFLSVDALGAFLYEYFIQTTETVGNSMRLGYSFPVIAKAAYFRIFVPLAVVFAGTLLFARMPRQHRFFPVAAFLFFALLSTQGTAGLHYFACSYQFAVFFFIAFAERYKRFAASRYKWIIACVAILVVVFNIAAKRVVGNLFWQNYDKNITDRADCSNRKSFYYFESIIAQKRKPKIILWRYYFPCMASEALPGCKYFCPQLGETQGMMQERWNACKGKKADFVLIQADSIDKVRTLVSLGYTKYPQRDDMVLLGKEKLDLPKEDFTVGNLDVLLKRRVKFEYDRRPW